MTLGLQERTASTGKSHHTTHLHLTDRPKAILSSADLLEPSEWAALQDYNELGFSTCWTGHGQTLECRGRRDLEGRHDIPSFD